MKNMQTCCISIGEETIESVDIVKNLGVLLNTQMDFRAHISHVVKVCRYYIRMAWIIRRFLNEEAAK